MGYKILGEAKTFVEQTSKDVASTAASVAADAPGIGYKMLGQFNDFLSSFGAPMLEQSQREAAAVDTAYTGAKDTYKVLSSTPIATMLDDVFVPAMGRKITEANFSPEAVQTLRQIALDNKLKAGDKMKINYEDFNKYGAKMSARFVSGTNEDVNSLKEKLMNLSPADEVKMTLGEAMISVDDQGNIKVLDQYDFNSWAYYGQGKQENGKYRELTADEFEKSDITFTEALMDTIQNSPSDYQMVRNLAFLFGSRDYEGTERDTGRKVEINLGTIE